VARVIKDHRLKKGETPTSLLRNPSYSVGARFMYGLLDTYGDTPFPSQNTLSKDVGLSISQIYRWLKELETSHFMRIFRGKTKQATNYYVLTVPELWDTLKHPDLNQSPVNDLTDVKPITGEGVNQAQVKGLIVNSLSSNSLTSLTQPQPKPLNPLDNSPSSSPVKSTTEVPTTTKESKKQQPNFGWNINPLAESFSRWYEKITEWSYVPNKFDKEKLYEIMRLPNAQKTIDALMKVLPKFFAPDSAAVTKYQSLRFTDFINHAHRYRTSAEDNYKITSAKKRFYPSWDPRHPNYDPNNKSLQASRQTWEQAHGKKWTPGPEFNSEAFDG
jgi:hypothetical protein